MNVDFNRGWDDYKNGFGDIDGDYWLGNEAIHYITAHRTNSMRLEISNNFGGSFYGLYQTFRIAGEDGNYRLFYQSPSGTVLCK